MHQQPGVTLIREAEASAFVADIKDTLVRELTLMCLGSMRMRFVRAAGVSDAEWGRQLPHASVDAYFYVVMMSQIFEKKDAVRVILEGKTLSDATGWDV